MSQPPFGMEKEIRQIKTNEYSSTTPYNPYNSPTTAQPQYYNSLQFSKPGCFREKKPCVGCPWRHECGNIENGHKEDR